MDMNGPGYRRTLNCTQGAVYVEFLLCFIPVFILFLGTVQLSLLCAAKLVVKHAAYRGARSASVLLADDPAYYDGEPVGHLGQPPYDPSGPANGGNPSGNQSPPAAAKYLAALGGLLGIEMSSMPAPWASAPIGRRSADILQAVYMPLSALTPNLSEFSSIAQGLATGPSLMDALGREHWSRLALSFSGYNDATTAVRYPRTPNDDAFFESQVDTESEDLTVQVTHLYHCSVPLVAALICRPARQIALTYLASRVSVPMAPGQDHRAPPSASTETGDASSAADEDEQRLLDDLNFIPSRGGLAALGASGTYVFVLRERATLPSQWAPYPYAPQDP